MKDFELRAAEAMIAAQVGAGAPFYRYNSSADNAMNITLAIAKRVSQVDFDIYWVESGAPHN